MLRFLLGVFLSLLVSLSAFSLSLAEAEASIRADKTLDLAEQNRQVAGLYRLSGKTKESFEILAESLEKGVFNDWMLEDFSALGISLRKEKVVIASANKLLKSTQLNEQLGGLLLKSLIDLKHAPEQAIENLRQFSRNHTGKEVSGLFLLLLQRSYEALGNEERSQFFSAIREENFPNYYVLRKSSKKELARKTKPISSPKGETQTSQSIKEKEGRVTILQVGSFKASRIASVARFKNRLKRLGLEPVEEVSGDTLRLRLSTTNPVETAQLLQKEGIDFYVVKGPLLPPSFTKASSSFPSLAKSTIQVGIFSSAESANRHKETLAKDGFTQTRVIWREDNRLFYVFLQSSEPEETLKQLKTKGYDAFIKNLE